MRLWHDLLPPGPRDVMECFAQEGKSAMKGDFAKLDPGLFIYVRPVGSLQNPGFLFMLGRSAASKITCVRLVGGPETHDLMEKFLT